MTRPADTPPAVSDASAPAALIDRLAGPGSEAAWREFLTDYGPFILQVSREIEPDPDDAGQAFLFACERLAADRFRRLRQYDPAGPARFTTWLRTVCCHLALDARRQRLGRLRPLASVSRATPFEQRVFACHEQGLSTEETAARLAHEFPEVTAERVARAEHALGERLTARERWILASRRPTTVPLDTLVGEDGREPAALADSQPNPEQALLDAEGRARLDRALAELPAGDRLLLDLRFRDGLTLARVASLCQLKDQWTADRRIRDVVRRLRESLSATG